MKNLLRKTVLAALLPLAAVGLSSCGDSGDAADWVCILPAQAVVTLKTTPATGQLYMQLNDSVTLTPVNMRESPYGNRELRAIVEYEYADTLTSHYSYAVRVTHIDTICTRPMSPVVDDMAGDYGGDPIGGVYSWNETCDDGYLTLHYRSAYSGNKPHDLRLARTGDDTVTLFYNANGDSISGNGGVDGNIAFRLNDLPDTKGRYRPLTVKWTTAAGEDSVRLRYKSRE